jgi:hypothetical protein
METTERHSNVKVKRDCLAYIRPWEADMNLGEYETVAMGRRKFLSQLSLAVTGSSLALTTTQGRKVLAK